MTRAAAKATEAAEDLLSWLRSQPRGRVQPPDPIAPLPGPAAENPGADGPKDFRGPDTPRAAAPAPAPGPWVGSGEPAVRPGGVPEHPDRHAPDLGQLCHAQDRADPRLAGEAPAVALYLMA
jgi:hypothetical protein